MLSKCQVKRRHSILTSSHPAGEPEARRLPLTMAESTVDLLPALLSATKLRRSALGKQNESFWFLESFSLVKERG